MLILMVLQHDFNGDDFNGVATSKIPVASQEQEDRRRQYGTSSVYLMIDAIQYRLNTSSLY